MGSAILSDSGPFRKDDTAQGGLASLDSLNTKLHALASIAKQAISDRPRDVDLFHTLSGIADLLQAACAQSDEIEPNQIAADVAAMQPKSEPSV